MTDRPQGLGPARARILGMLQDAGEPMSASALARRLGTHPNTARFHLEALAESGLAERVREARSTPGRPSIRYAASPSAPPAAHRSYRLLAEILTAHLVAGHADPEGTAAAAGAAYGRTVPWAKPGRAGERGPLPAVAAGTAAAVAAAAESFTAMGFESRVGRHGARTWVDVTSCPFLEVATSHLPVVCAVHRGVMDGVLEGLGSPLRVAGLEPLVEPGLCVARLGEEDAAPGGAPAAEPAR